MASDFVYMSSYKQKNRPPCTTRTEVCFQFLSKSEFTLFSISYACFGRLPLPPKLLST